MSAAAFAYRPVPIVEVPRPCQGCWEADAVVAVWHGGVWRLSLCAACALAHREGEGSGEREGSGE